MYKILIADDLPSLRSHARKTIGETYSGCSFVEAAHGGEAVEQALTFRPDLILMDVAMPELSGIKAARQIWTQNPQTKILFWSQHQDEAYIRELGKIVPDQAIHGYILKSEDDERLVEALRSILEHDLPFIGREIENVKRRLKDRNSAVTDLEYQTLLDIFAGLTDKAIAQKEHISYRGAQNRLSTLLAKLLKGEESFLKETAGKEIFNPRTRLIYVALKRGLIKAEDLELIEDDLGNWLFEQYGWEVR